MLFRFVELSALKSADETDSGQIIPCFVVDLSSPDDSNSHPTVVTLHTRANEVLILTSLPSSPTIISKKVLEASDASILRSSQQHRTILVRKNNMYIETNLLPLNSILSTTEVATTCGILIKVMPPRQCSKGDYLCTIYLVDETSFSPVIVTVFSSELAKLDVFTVDLRRTIDRRPLDRPFFCRPSTFRSTKIKSQRARRLVFRE